MQSRFKTVPVPTAKHVSTNVCFIGNQQGFVSVFSLDFVMPKSCLIPLKSTYIVLSSKMGTGDWFLKKTKTLVILIHN